jgi:hypothetical protein
MFSWASGLFNQIPRTSLRAYAAQCVEQTRFADVWHADHEDSQWVFRAQVRVLFCCVWDQNTLREDRRRQSDALTAILSSCLTSSSLRLSMNRTRWSRRSRNALIRG